VSNGLLDWNILLYCFIYSVVGLNFSWGVLFILLLPLEEISHGIKSLVMSGAYAMVVWGLWNSLRGGDYSYIEESLSEGLHLLRILTSSAMVDVSCI